MGFLLKKQQNYTLNKNKLLQHIIILHLKEIPHGFLIFEISEVELSHL